MADVIGPVSVWGGRTPTPEDVFDVIDREYSEKDLARQAEKLGARTSNKNPIVMDGTKFSPEPREVALYRSDGMMARVPLDTFHRYLRKRDKAGNRIFFVRPPVEPPMLESDPCPVKVAGKTCGKRMLDQFELMRHIQKKHGDRAHFYLSKVQLEMVTGKGGIPISEGIPLQPSTAPFRPVHDDNVLEVGAVEDRLEIVEEAMADQKAVKTPPEPLVVVQLETVKLKPKSHSKTSATPHTCKMQGRLGRYDNGCPRCLELIQEKLEAV